MVIYFLLVLAPIYVNIYPCSEYVNWVFFSAVTVALLVFCFALLSTD